MRNSFLYSALIIFLLTPARLWAGQPFSLEECFKAALKRSEVLATQQELVVQAEENYHRAWGAIFPSVNGSYSYLQWNAPGLTHSGNTEDSAGQQTLKIIADQPLFRGFRDFAAVNSAKALITAQKQARQWAGTQLYRDVARAFYTCLAVQKDLDVLDKELELTKKGSKNFRAGSISAAPGILNCLPSRLPRLFLRHKGSRCSASCI